MDTRERWVRRADDVPSYSIGLPQGVTDWSIRFTSTNAFDVWDDQNATIVASFTTDNYPDYTRIWFRGDIGSSSNFLRSRTHKIDYGALPPEFPDTAVKAETCADITANGYYFDSFEQVEYVDGLLRLHLRLKTPYNNGRTFRVKALTADETCITTNPTYSSLPHTTSFTPYIRYYSFRMTSPTHWVLWDDENAVDPITGESVNPVTADSILESFSVGPFSTAVYRDFTLFMDALVADETIEAWEPFAYDWRFAPDSIVEMSDMVSRFEELAGESETGQVTIVAHSYGGLVGKALIMRLEAEGRSDLVDSFVMVGSPQLGTPQAISSILHGDDEGILGGLIVDATTVRSVAQHMPAAYTLLPSPKYFEDVTEPVIVFDPSASFTEEWREYWGDSIRSFLDFFSFASGGGVTRVKPEPLLLRIPEVLDPDLLSDAALAHSSLDNYVFPAHIRVVEVAGWGMPTVKAIEYTTKHFLESYETLFTVEGDNTVVYPSALSSEVESYFVNLSLYNKDSGQNSKHRDMIGNSPVTEILRQVIEEQPILETEYVAVTKPPLTEIDTQLLVSTHSPVLLGAHDVLGNFTGINPSQDLSAALLTISEGIPGGSFIVSGESQHLFLPAGGIYSVSYHGIGSGPTTVELGILSNDTVIPVALYTNLPTTGNTVASFTLTESEEPHITLDQNNDGIVDFYAAPDDAVLSLGELLVNLKTIVQSLEVKEKLKKNLIKKINKIEKKISKNKLKPASKSLMSLGKTIEKKGGKGKLSDVEAQEILKLLEQIENAIQ